MHSVARECAPELSKWRNVSLYRQSFASIYGTCCLRGCGARGKLVVAGVCEAEFYACAAHMDAAYDLLRSMDNVYRNVCVPLESVLASPPSPQNN